MLPVFCRTQTGLPSKRFIRVYKPEEQIVSVSATRLHNIAGKYTGKDDPVAIVRTQGLFPAPEEIVEPYLLGHFVTGDCRGSHVMPLMPVAINTPVAGPFCLPLVSCLGFSMDAEGLFTREHVDLFENVAWDATRLKVQQKADEWRRQALSVRRWPLMPSYPTRA